MRQRLIIFNDDSIFFDGKNYLVKNPLTELFNELSAYFDIVISSPFYQIDNDKKFRTYTKVSNNIVCSPRPFFSSVEEFLKMLPKILIPTLINISVNIKNSDLVMLRLPSPIGIFVYFFAKYYSKPNFLYVAGDIKEVVIKGKKYKGFKKPFAFILASIFDWLTKFMAKNSLVFTNGKELCNKLKTNSNQCINFVPTLIRKETIFLRKDTCQNKSIKLIFVGRLVSVKGLPYLLRSFKILRERGRNVYLTIVGEGPAKKELLLLANELGITNVLEFKEHLSFGNELFKLYKESDIFILPSLSEGLPKTLFEAMAFGLPIVATKVGGIPGIVQNKKTALLVSPGSIQELTEAIETIIIDSELRQTLIKNGYKFVELYTLEKQAEFMATIVNQYFKFK